MKRPLNPENGFDEAAIEELEARERERAQRDYETWIDDVLHDQGKWSREDYQFKEEDHE